jgi:CheY-like chemotaxis protein
VVTSVENGELALAAASAGAFDIVLMDCQMPVMDGQTATAKLRELERNTGKRRTYIVALTADATAANKQRCHEAGVDLVATKPISQSRLRELVMLALQSRAKAGEPPHRVANGG